MIFEGVLEAMAALWEQNELPQTVCSEHFAEEGGKCVQDIMLSLTNV